MGVSSFVRKEGRKKYARPVKRDAATKRERMTHDVVLLLAAGGGVVAGGVVCCCGFIFLVFHAVALFVKRTFFDKLIEWSLLFRTIGLDKCCVNVFSWNFYAVITDCFCCCGPGVRANPQFVEPLFIWKSNRGKQCGKGCFVARF